MQKIVDESGEIFEDQGLNSLFHSFKSEKLTKRVENWEKANLMNLAIASYHVVNGEQTSYFLEKFLNKERYFTKSDFKKHLTTYGRKTNRFF